MKNNIIFGAIVIFCLSFNTPVYAQWGLSRQNPQIGLVKEELRGETGKYDYDANDPSKWIASSQKGDISIIGWKSRETDKPNTYLVSYSFKDVKDNAEKGWWWEVNVKEKIVRVVTHNLDLQNKYNIGKSNYADVSIIEGMTKFAVKTILGEPEQVDNSNFGDTWYYFYKTKDNRTQVKKIQFESIDNTVVVIDSYYIEAKCQGH